MPSISWSSWGSEVHFPHLLAGPMGCEVPAVWLGDCVWVPQSSPESLGWLRPCFREQTWTCGKEILHCCSNWPTYDVGVQCERFAPHCTGSLPSPPSNIPPTTFISIPPMGIISFNTFTQLIGIKHKLCSDPSSCRSVQTPLSRRQGQCYLWAPSFRHHILALKSY